MGSFELSSFSFLLISLILSFELNKFDSGALKRPKSYSPIPSKRSKIDDVEQGLSSKFVEDSEMAYILQIEEIVLSENEINDKTAK
jgi:hypothetical protein